MSERPRKKITTSNWTEFTMEDLPISEEERTWNRYMVLKHLEIMAMLASLKTVKFKNLDTILCTAPGDGGCDPIPDS